jgi:DNA polymerase-3 subunit alpha (Gram-positive type)
MNLRGVSFLPVDLYASGADQFLLESVKIRPPLTALPGLGDAAARLLISSREEKPFLSVEDLRVRVKITSAVLEILRAQGCLSGMPETSQLSLFDGLM